MIVYRHKKGFLIFFRILLVCYYVLLIYCLFFCEQLGRDPSDQTQLQYNLMLFHEINRYLKYGRKIGGILSFLNVFGNVLIFVPFGFVSPILVRKLRRFGRIAGAAFGLSLCVEVVQLLSRTGSFDVDDILLNTLGGMLGFAIYAVIQHRRDINVPKYLKAQKERLYGDRAERHEDTDQKKTDISEADNHGK